jgi:hypothetical protein
MSDTPDLSYRLPCDVRLAPATTIRQGCTLATLIEALKQREAREPVPFSPVVRKLAGLPEYRDPTTDLMNEIDQLRASLATAERERDEARRLGHEAFVIGCRHQAACAIAEARVAVLESALRISNSALEK